MTKHFSNSVSGIEDFEGNSMRFQHHNGMSNEKLSEGSFSADSVASGNDFIPPRSCSIGSTGSTLSNASGLDPDPGFHGKIRFRLFILNYLLVSNLS